MPIDKVFLVGHCGADAFSLQYAVKQAANRDDLFIRTAVDTDEQVQNAGPQTLLLVNRELGNVLNRRQGVDLIREMSQRDNPPRMMLISNYADAQRQAEEAGALPGFGKAELHQPHAAERLREALQD